MFGNYFPRNSSSWISSMLLAMVLIGVSSSVGQAVSASD
jgi:hypothetical protein